MVEGEGRVGWGEPGGARAGGGVAAEGGGREAHVGFGEVEGPLGEVGGVFNDAGVDEVECKEVRVARIGTAAEGFRKRKSATKFHLRTFLLPPTHLCMRVHNVGL